MNRKTLISFGALIVLVVVAFVALRQPEKGERVGERPRPVARLKSTDFDTIEVTKAKVTTVIKREGAKYKVVAPVAYPADESAAKQAFETLQKLEFGGVVTEQKAKHVEYEVVDDGLRVAVKNGSTPVADLLIGKSVGAGTMVRAVGKDEVWQADGAMKFIFDKGATDWRDKSISTFTPADAEKVTVKSKTGASITVKKTDKKTAGEEQWAVVDASMKVDKLDNSTPVGIVSALSALKTNDFADGAAPAVTGLGDPALTVTVSLKGGKTVTALVGNKKGDDEFYVKSADALQIFVVKRYNLDRVNKQPIDFRDKTICNITEGDLSDVAVTHGADSFTLAKVGSEWKATKPPKFDLDPAKVTAFSGAFKAWKATGYAEDSSPKATGLGKPQAVILAKSKAATCSLKVGDQTKDKQAYFVQTASSPDVYTVAKWATDRILVKLNDIKKAATVAHK